MREVSGAEEMAPGPTPGARRSRSVAIIYPAVWYALNDAITHRLETIATTVINETSFFF